MLEAYFFDFLIVKSINFYLFYFFLTFVGTFYKNIRRKKQRITDFFPYDGEKASTSKTPPSTSASTPPVLNTSPTTVPW